MNWQLVLQIMDMPIFVIFNTLIKIYGAFIFLNSHEVPKLPTMAEDTAPKYETYIINLSVYFQAFS